jgi:aspartyl-tRNA(Asn)/glutamyl-tRNA(Gln) amidotransferase subunit B
LARHGWLDIEADSGQTKRIRIRRVHMEEDTGKLTHLAAGGSLVDYNRSGVPLLEIVSEPDINSGDEARAYSSKIRQILRYLEVNTGDMEKGVLRVEPNISIRPVGSTDLGTRTELKNLNSFRSLAEGTDFEVARQASLLDAGEKVIQETRGWHDTRRVTFSQRVKEEADDYRYFAEPDLPPLDIDPQWIESVREALPELPDAKIARYQEEFALSAYDAQVLAEDRQVADWYDTAVAAGGNPKRMANWIINELFRLMNEHAQTIADIKVSPQALVQLSTLVTANTINNNTAKEVLAEMFASGHSAEEIVAAQGLAQISDEETLSALVDQILDENEDQVAAYLAGKEQLRGWFVGQVMRATRGKANPALVNKLLSRQLADRV